MPLVNALPLPLPLACVPYRRMKIGICEGMPRSIIPDHMGRADYHGASINQAARYMDAAAHGGMIAVEAVLAQKVCGGEGGCKARSVHGGRAAWLGRRLS